jgi:type I restriction enzyme, R subunit
MTEFKQILGRGTRVHEDTKKFYFSSISGARQAISPTPRSMAIPCRFTGEDDPVEPP